MKIRDNHPTDVEWLIASLMGMDDAHLQPLRQLTNGASIEVSGSILLSSESGDTLVIVSQQTMNLLHNAFTLS